LFHFPDLEVAHSTRLPGGQRRPGATVMPQAAR
jgi:hypothetical protein